MCIRLFFNIEMQLKVVTCYPTSIFSVFWGFFTILLHDDKYVQFSANVPHPKGLVIVP